MLHNDRLSYIYSGTFDDEITSLVLSLSEFNVDKIDEFSKLKKRIAFLMAESFQNIIRHKEDTLIPKLPFGRESIFITRNIGNIYYIASANVIKNNRVDQLKSKLEQINKLDLDELKSFYIENLDHPEFTNKGGAGLGLIEMARRSKQPLDYDFEPFDDQYSFFYLMIKIHGKGSETKDKQILPPLSICKTIHNNISILNIFVVYKGDFSKDTVIPVLKMIEGNLDIHTEHLMQKKRTFSVMTEMLQNISIHGKKEGNVCEGIFMIGFNKGKFVVTAGNIVDNELKASLTKKLNSVCSMSRDELKMMYKEVLLDGDVRRLQGASLGLITIARDTSQRPEFAFYDLGKGKSLFILDARI